MGKVHEEIGIITYKYHLKTQIKLSWNTEPIWIPGCSKQSKLRFLMGHKWIFKFIVKFQYSQNVKFEKVQKVY